MTVAPSRGIPRRELPGGGPTLSLLGVVVDTGPGASAGPGLIERLRQARRAGVTTFDLADSAHPGPDRWLLSEAFPTPDPELVVIVGAHAAAEEPIDPSGAPLPVTLTRVVPPEAEGREARALPGTIVIDGPRDRGRPASESAARAGVGPPPPARAVRLDPAAESLPPEAGSGLYSGPLSLLDTRLATLLEGQQKSGTRAFLARDPFAGGRLDGSRFSGSWLEQGPAAGPASLRSLEVEFAPVLQLEFLTRGKVRTLAQAAVQYATYHPWVASVLLPLPSPDRWEEVFSSLDRPPLTSAEVDRVERRPGAAASKGTTERLRDSNSPGE